MVHLLFPLLFPVFITVENGDLIGFSAMPNHGNRANIMSLGPEMSML